MSKTCLEVGLPTQFNSSYPLHILCLISCRCLLPSALFYVIIPLVFDPLVLRDITIHTSSNTDKDQVVQALE